jgi:hypothetical protein
MWIMISRPKLVMYKISKKCMVIDMDIKSCFSYCPIAQSSREVGLD